MFPNLQKDYGSSKYESWVYQNMIDQNKIRIFWEKYKNDPDMIQALKDRVPYEQEPFLNQLTIQEKYLPQDGKSFLSLQFEQPKWLIDHYLPLGGLTMLASTPGNWKTWLTLTIILAVSRGSNWLDKFSTIQGNILLINEEDIPSELQLRMKKLGITGENLFILSRKGLNIDDPYFLSSIEDLKKKNNIKLIIIDNLALVQEREENSSVEVSKLWKRLRSLTTDSCSILSLHHFRKRDPKFKISIDNIMLKEMPRGSSAHIAAQDSFLAIDPLPDERDGSKAFVVYQAKCRSAKEQDPIKVLVKDQDNSIIFSFAGLFDKALTALEKTMDLVMESLSNGKPMTVKMLETAGCGIDKTIRQALGVFKSQQKIIEKKAFEFGLTNENKRTLAYILPFEQELRLDTVDDPNF